MKKGILILIILAIIIAISIAILSWPFIFKNQNNSNQEPILQNKVEGIHILSPRVMAQVSSPIKISGKVDGAGWSGFEGQVGNIKLVDPNGNVLAETSLLATTEWTKQEVAFEAELSFDSKFKGPAILFFHNENPSSDPAKDKEVAWPVFIR